MSNDSRKNISDAYCYRVRGLFVPYETPKTIDSDINNYINRIQQHTARLDDCFNRRDKEGFISVLEQIAGLLRSVYAKQALSYTTTLLDSAKDRGMDYCQLLLQQAIADFLLLSIEMQRAQKLDIGHMLKYRNIEKNEEIVRNIAAIGRMLSVGDYKGAQSMASELADTEASFAKLSSMLNAREYDRAKQLAETIEKEHTGFIRKGSMVKPVKTVLAVDDRPEILNNVSAALRSHYKVLGAPDGNMALQVMDRYKIDLFYLDIDMPGIDGFELASRIRASAKYAKTPIIFLTSNSSRENIDKAIALGSDDFIVKPSNHVNLLVKARKYMDDN